MRKASCYIKYYGGRVQCTLHSHNCIINDDARNICNVRENTRGAHAESYGLFSAIHLDPVEKKPLYHFYPGQMILPVDSLGGNLSCSSCQNYEIFYVTVDQHLALHSFEPEKHGFLSRTQSGALYGIYGYHTKIIN